MQLVLQGPHSSVGLTVDAQCGCSAQRAAAEGGVTSRGSEGAPLGGGRVDRAGDAAKQASPRGGRGQTQDTRRSR
jgi:hypothetical protein